MALALLLLGFAACEGERPSRLPGGAMGPNGGSGQAAIPHMEAQGKFFDGRIEIEVMLAPAGTKWSRDAESSGGGSSRGAGGGGLKGGLGMGGGGRGGGRGRGGGGAGGPRGGGAGSSDQAAPPIQASNQPPIQLRLRLTNRGDTPADVEVVDFESALGNFVVQPTKITVKPAEPIEAEPMVSRLGVFDQEIPLTVELHVAGHTEQQVLTLRVTKEPVPTPSPSDASLPAAPPPP